MTYRYFSSTNLPSFHFVDGEADAFGVALGVKLDLAEGGFHHVRAEGFHDLLGVGAAGGLDGFKQGDRRGVGVVIEGARLCAVLLLMVSCAWMFMGSLDTSVGPVA